MRPLVLDRNRGSGHCATATPFPAAPANLRAAPGIGRVTLHWDDPMDAGISGYQLFHYLSRRRPSQPVWNAIAGSDASTTRHPVTGLTNGEEYTFALRASAGAVHGDTSVVTATPRSCRAIGVGGLRDTSVTLGQSVSMTAVGSGSQASYWYSLSVAPQTGSAMSIGERNGSITGTPTAAGTYTVTVTVRDDDGCTGTGTFTLKVCPVITVTGIGNATLRVNQEITLAARATGGCGTVTFTRKHGPTWVIVHANGNIRGTAPSTPGTHPVTLKATDAEGNSVDKPFTITVRCSRVRIEDIADVTVTAGASRSFTASAVGGVRVEDIFEGERAGMGTGLFRRQHHGGAAGRHDARSLRREGAGAGHLRERRRGVFQDHRYGRLS